MTSLPELRPIRESGTTGDLEGELKELALTLFSDLLADAAHDVDVSGIPHLGTLDLLRRSINYDGLIMLPGEWEEEATRYLYRGWTAGNRQGRGLHFLKVYLQLLFGGEAEVEQLWFSISDEYPVSTAQNTWWLPRLDDPDLKLDGSWQLGTPILSRSPTAIDDRAGVFLSSRVSIALDFERTDIEPLQSLRDIILEIVPARIVPVVKYWIRGSLSAWNLDGRIDFPNNALTVNGNALMFNGAYITYGTNE